MSDPAPSTFMPSGASTAVTSSSYVIPLARARFILKGQFFHPVKGTDEPLPPHQFYLFCISPRGGAPVLGEPSESDGVSWINYTDDAREEIPGSSWALAWRPLAKRPDGSFAPAADAARGEAWLDLDKMEWVEFKDVAIVEKRKLVRLALWSSLQKVKQGGFKQSPPKTQFGTTGQLVYDKSELGAFGDRGKPWTVQVDHGLFRSYVRMSYYDVKEKKRKPVPPGLVVHAIGARALSGPATGTDSRVAAGTAIDDDGTVYLVHERTKANLAKSNFAYFFFTGRSGTDDHGVIDFSKSAPRDRVSSVARDPSAKRVDRYVLPREWHSKGWEAWTKEDKGKPQRKSFSALRTADTSAKEPLCFHLDDAVLAAGPTDPIKLAKDARATLLDHLLHARDADDKRPHLWKTKLSRNYLRAEDAVYVDGQTTERLTRIVFQNGVVYELREGRVLAAGPASFGTIECIGARAAITNLYDDKHRHVSYLSGNPSRPDFLSQVKGRTVQHLIDVSDDVDHTVDGKSVKLFHLLVWVPVYFENRIGADGEAGMAQLERAAERLNQSHPGHPGQPAPNRKPAEFVLAPDGEITAGARVVRVRHYFAEVPSTFTDAVKILLTQSSDPKARAGANSATKLVTMFKGDIGPRYAAGGEAGQDASTNRFTLAHEMGHILGFPDEYVEGHPTLGWEYAAWNQYAVDAAAARPFGADAPSIMQENNKPRLRHYWYYVDDLSRVSDFKKLLDPKPYMPMNFAPVTGGRLVYERPFCGVIVGETGGYKPVFPSMFLASGRTHSDASFYRLGTDEGTVERMYKKSPADVGTKASDVKMYDGLLLIRIKFMVQFAGDVDNKVNRAKVFTALRRLMLDDTHYKKQFAIELDPSTPKPGRSHDKPHLRRVFVCFAPEFDVANSYTSAVPPKAVPGDHHVFIDIVKARLAPHPLLSATPPARLPLLVTEIDESILRYAVGEATFKEDPVTHVKTLRTTLDAADMQFLADGFHGYLGDAASPTRKMRNT